MKVQVCPKGKMKRLIAMLAGALVLAPALAHATPSTTFWAPSTPFIQPYGLLHVTYDTYFLKKGAYPVDTGLTIGLLPFDKFQAEGGFDLVYPTANLAVPILFNAKIGSPEGAFGDWSPGWSAGMFGVGFEKDVTDYNVFHFMLGKTFPVIGNLEVGFYYGLNKNLFISNALDTSAGATHDNNQFGIQAGWFSPAIELKKPYMDKIILAADIMTGENAFGAAGGGVYFYFTPMIDLLAGPVFFLDKESQPGNSSVLWSMQLDVDMDLFTKKAD